MKRVSMLLSAGLALSATGCGLMKATGVMKEPPPNTAVSLEIDRAKSFGDSDTIVVPTAYLRLTVDGKASASSDGDGLRSIGRGNSGNAHVHAKYKVNGLDKSLAQELAKLAYDDFVSKLRAAGYKVLTYDDVKDQEFVSGLTRYEKDAAYGIAMENGQMVATPTDDQAIKPGTGGNVISPYQRFGKSKFKEGTLLIPTYTITSPLAKTDSYSSGASIELMPGMALTQGGVNVLTNGGGWGSVKLKKAVYGLSDKTGEIVKVADNTPTAANALNKTMSLLTGMGGRNVKSSSYELTIDRAAFRDAATKGFAQFNDEVAKVAAGAKKS